MLLQLCTRLFKKLDVSTAHVGIFMRFLTSADFLAKAVTVGNWVGLHWKGVA